MMKKYLVVFCALVFVFSMAEFANALSNGGFETGDLTDWTATVPSGGSATVVTTHTTEHYSSMPNHVYDPVEGSYFALLKTRGPAQNYYDREVFLEQTINLSAGDTIEGWAAFDARVKTDREHRAWVRIYNNQTGQLEDTPWMRYSDELEFYSDDWWHWAWEATSSGSYRIQLAAADYSSFGGGGSYALFDAHVVSAAPQPVIPEPGTLLLFGAGLIGLFAVGRKRLVKK